ncbi:MAG TPA: hypothetical protein VFN73_03900 [Propionibacteriaceae bacterium]|nr:hypothetical protein [Propionibacteriaceae bacterium]
MRTSAERALVAAGFVVAGVAAFLLAYLFIGAGRPGTSSAQPDVAKGAAAEAAVPGTATPAPGLPSHPAAVRTPWQPGPTPVPPSAVGSLRLASNTMSTFTIAWDPAVDQSGIRYYRVLVNGFLADTTSTLDSRLGWLGDKSPILVQVAAVDTTGTYGPWSALYVIPPPDSPPAPATSAPAPPASTAPASTTPSPSSPASSVSTVTPSAALTPTATATASGLSSGSPSPSATASAADTPTPSASAGDTASPSATPTASDAPSPGL